MSDDLEARGHHAITHDGETYIKLADASVTFSVYRKDIAAKDAEITRLRARVAELEAVLDPVVLQAAEGFPVEEAIREVVEGSLLTDQQKIEVYLAYKYRWIKAFFAGGRQKGMEEAAKRCELPCIGDHMNAYGRYFAAAIRAAAEEGKS